MSSISVTNLSKGSGKQKGEAIDEIIKELKKEDSGFSEDFESFSRRCVRRLGRLLPDAGRVLPDDRSAVSKVYI